MNELNVKKKLPDDEKVVFVPEEEIKAIENIFGKMEQAKQEFCKVAEGLKTGGTGSLKCKLT